MARRLVISTPRLSASESAANVSRRMDEDGAGFVVVVAVDGGLNGMGTGQGVGESDAARSKERDASTDAGDTGAALDPL